MQDLAAMPAIHLRLIAGVERAPRLDMQHHVDPDQAFDDEPTQPIERLPARVLVAEDDPALRALMVSRLRADGCEVIEAHSGDQALDALTDAAIDADHRPLSLVVLDNRMPGLTGMEISYLVRAWGMKMPVLLVTAYPDPQMFDEADRLNVRVLAKPFGFNQLSRIAAAAIERRPS